MRVFLGAKGVEVDLLLLLLLLAKNMGSGNEAGSASEPPSESLARFFVLCLTRTRFGAGFSVDEPTFLRFFSGDEDGDDGTVDSVVDAGDDDGGGAAAGMYSFEPPIGGCGLPFFQILVIVVVTVDIVELAVLDDERDGEGRNGGCVVNSPLFIFCYKQEQSLPVIVLCTKNKAWHRIVATKLLLLFCMRKRFDFLVGAERRNLQILLCSFLYLPPPHKVFVQVIYFFRKCLW